jgi:hypothetical protein
MILLELLARLCSVVANSNSKQTRALHTREQQWQSASPAVQSTYPQVAEAALGARGKAAVEAFLVLSQTGFCVAYVVFIYKNVPLLELGKAATTLLILPFQARPRALVQLQRVVAAS